MAAFKIHDLAVLLQPQWAAAKAAGGVPQISQKIDAARCGEETITTYDICQASQLVVNIACLTQEELKVLKKQLAQALDVVAQREYEVRAGPPTIDALEKAKFDALSEALAKIPKK